MLTLYLLRHGALVPDPEHRFLGQRHVPLSGTGRRQGLFWHQEFSDVPLCEVWTSDLPRCRDMTALVMAGRSIDVIPDPGFREISLGSWDGRSKDDVEARFPGALAARGNDLWNYVPCGGESFHQLSQRVLTALHRRLSSLPDGGTALLVAHSGVNRIILMHYMALGMDDFFAIPQPFAACTTLCYSPEDVDALKAAL